MKTTWPDQAGCLCARMSRGFNGQDAMGLMIVITLPANQTSNSCKGGAASTLKERDYKDFTDVVVVNKPPRKYIVRRLTPTECLRLQGLPDWWCDGADGSDSSIYRMAGNGIALPCAIDVLGRIADEIEREDSP